MIETLIPPNVGLRIAENLKYIDGRRRAYRILAIMGIRCRSQAVLGFSEFEAERHVVRDANGMISSVSAVPPSSRHDMIMNGWKSHFVVESRRERQARIPFLLPKLPNFSPTSTSLQGPIVHKFITANYRV